MNFFKQLQRHFKNSYIFDLSAQLSYYVLISFFPFMLLVITIIGYLPIRSDDVIRGVYNYLPSLAHKVFISNLEMVLRHESIALFSFSLIATLYLSSVAFYSLIRVLDHTYGVEDRRTLWKEWAMGILFMVGVLVGLLISLIASVFGDDVVNSFLQSKHHVGFEYLLNLLRWVVSGLFLVIIFVSLYMFAPNVKVSFIDALPGSIFSAVAWQVSSVIFSYYIEYVDYSHLYGTLSSAMALMVWFYWSSFVLILGGVINAINVRKQEV